MGARRYAGDYRLENVLGKNGKLRTVPVYRGTYFHFSLPTEQLHRLRRKKLILLCAASLGLAVPMFLTGELMRRWYVLLPLVLSLLPAAGLWVSVCHLFRAGEKVIREHKEQMQERFAARSAALWILAVLSLAGQLAALFSGIGPESWPVTLCTLVVILAALLLFLGRKELRLEPLPEEA